MPAPVSSLIPAADALRAHQVEPGHGVPVEVWEVMSIITDPRGRRGRRCELATVLVIALAAVGRRVAEPGRDHRLGRGPALLVLATAGDHPTTVTLHGKGGKLRRVPLMGPTARLLHDYLDRRTPHPGVGADADPLFQGPHQTR